MRTGNSCFVTVFIFLLSFISLQAQNEMEDIELFLVDSYVTQEKPYIFKLTFFTTERVKSAVKLDDEIFFIVSDTLSEDHSSEFDVTGQNFSGAVVVMYITLTNEAGAEVVKGPFEIILPQLEQKIETDQDLNLLTVCCFGGVIFGLPSPTAVLYDGETKWSLSKEIPVLSFYTSGYNYPAHYLGLEYQYINDVQSKHLYRLGYKYLHTIPVFEYISAGVNVYSDFKGQNGYSPEISVGLMRFYNVFTLYGRYRYNKDFEHNYPEFHEISIGLYSNFFSLNF